MKSTFLQNGNFFDHSRRYRNLRQKSKIWTMETNWAERARNVLKTGGKKFPFLGGKLKRSGIRGQIGQIGPVRARNEMGYGDDWGQKGPKMYWSVGTIMAQKGKKREKGFEME